MSNSFSKAWHAFRRSGVPGLLRGLADRTLPKSVEGSLPVGYRDVLGAGFTTPHPAAANPISVASKSARVAWIMSPPSAGSGGHQNIFRFIDVLERAGHKVEVFLYGPSSVAKPKDVADIVTSSNSFAKISASVSIYPGTGIGKNFDAVIASDWPTAYASYLDNSLARRIYFIQDFEPWFYPASTKSVLAENTYRMGFFGITAGGWLSDKLSREYGMKTASYDFAADGSVYRFENRERRKDVFFYARPETPRRGFELGVMALDLFSKARPESRIYLAGQDVKSMRLPFDYENLGSISLDRLNNIYNRCAAGLVISLSNLSLLPLELLSAGVIPVVNDGPNNRLVSSNRFIEYAPANPRSLADSLIRVVDRAGSEMHAANAAASIDKAGWDSSAKQFLSAFEGALYG